MRRQHYRPLTILMNGIEIGALSKTSEGSLKFEYNQKWLDTPGARPISLSLPLIDRPFTGDLVFNFFDNLLPENFQIRARIQANFQALSNQPYDLLAKIGRDCVGAIQIIEGDLPDFKNEIKYESLTDQDIASCLRSCRSIPLGMSKDKNFRISIAGVQEKTALLYHNNRWCLPVNETPTTHIFKLPIGLRDFNLDLSESCENEWLCAKIAAAFGLSVASCEIGQFEDMKALIVERFDRRLSSDGTWLIRLPQEDMCQALGISPNLKYQSDSGPGIQEIMKLLLGSISPIEDRIAFFQAQILFWLLAASDGHAKNFSIFIEPEGRYRLTPLYDIMSVYPLIQKKQLQAQDIKMAMALKGRNNHYNWFGIQRRHFLETAKRVNLSVPIAEEVLDTMLSKVDNVIEHVQDEIPKAFPSDVANSIFSCLRLMKKKLLKMSN